MNFELGDVFIIGLAYLSILFGIAYCAEKNWIPDRIVRHPIVFILSLGVATGAWSFYGMVDIAFRYGYGYLSYFFGIAILFLMGSVVIQPMLRIARLYQLSSLADMLAFRYRSQWVGILVTIFMVLAMMPLLALQITAVSDTVHILTNKSLTIFPGDNQQGGLAFVFCCIITLFAVLFGTRHLGVQERHNGLVAAIAFESLSKLLVLGVISAAVMWNVFDGYDDLEKWLRDQPHIMAVLRDQQNNNDLRYLLLLFFSSAVAIPHLFHMLFAERPNNRALRAATWGFPLYLLLLSLPVLPILWATTQLGSDVSIQYATLNIGRALHSPQLELAAFIGGLSAASGTIIVCTLALASMCLNHLVLAFRQPDTQDIYSWLLWLRRILIVGIILMSYLFFRIIDDQNTLANLGIAAFSGVLQLLPGVLAMLYWPEANRNGFIAGLSAGMLLWLLLILAPLIFSDTAILFEVLLGQPFDLDQSWQSGVQISLGANTLLFIFVSLLSKTSGEELAAAEICSTDELNKPIRQALDVHSPSDMRDRLSPTLGKVTAEREVTGALNDLSLSTHERRPYALRRLRERIEANLSGLLGPSTAYEIINQCLPYKLQATEFQTEDIQFIESRLETNVLHLTGLAAELDTLRRYHRETLKTLPIGVCIVGSDREITMWNSTVEELTGISANDVVGSSVDALAEPWSSVIGNFAQSNESHQYKQHINDGDRDRWISLHKTLLRSDNMHTADQAILIEDLTETQLLEEELAHSERLASVGRLAAGVAHEIGNPITGIACLAQNLASENDDKEVQYNAREILQQTKRVTSILQSLVNFSHTGSGNTYDYQKVNLEDCINEAIKLLLLNKDAKEVQFHSTVPSDTQLIGDPQRLLQVFINLLSNARDAVRVNGKINIHVHEEPQTVEISVSDDGTGIPKQTQEQIFEPFFTTKQPGEGTGLGLSLVYSIIEDHSGQITLESPTDKAKGLGTRFKIRLPRYIEET